MTSGNQQRSVLLIGKSQRVLDDTAAALRDLGCTAQATSDFFSDITGRLDVTQIDLVALGGAVPPDRKAELKEQIGAINPRVTEASLRQVEAIFATALGSAPDGPTAAQPGEEGR
jgi:hypothetical protein